MRWMVTFDDAATDELATIWLNAADRKAVTKAAAALERELRDDPDVKGKPHFGGRAIRQNPLTFYYDLIPDDCLVRVTQVLSRNP
jgi:hypothetical protein